MSLQLDLEKIPWSLPGSRLYIFQDADGLALISAEYETKPSESAVWRNISVRSDSGWWLPVRSVTPAAIEWDGGLFLTFSGPNTLVFHNPGNEVVELELQLGVGRVPPHRLEPGQSRAFAVHADLTTKPLRIDGAQARLETDSVWTDWMQRCPRVQAEYADLTELNWYCLGVNTIQLRLPAEADKRLVVPSLRGYVAVWQWDSYFIACGLRQGDLALARDQVEAVLGHPSANGQLPDVVHDGGILASFADLPKYEFDAYAKQSGMPPDDLARISITKPPLAAWALARLGATDTDWIRRHWQTVVRSHDWWWKTGNRHGMPYPVYEHPFSSGLDDSPAFDRPGPRTTSDLVAYLLLQEEVLAELAVAAGLDWDQTQSAERCERLISALNETWDPGLAGYWSLEVDGRDYSDTVLNLLPLLAAGLPAVQAERLIAALDDESRFGGEYRLPTVARSDDDYSPSQMWRGPVWLSTNYLVIEALERRGLRAEAVALARSSLKLIADAGGPYEYYRSDNGEPAARAVPCFSWTAALAVDLAARYFPGQSSSYSVY